MSAAPPTFVSIYEWSELNPPACAPSTHIPCSFAFGIVLIELLTGCSSIESRELVETSSAVASALIKHPGSSALEWPMSLLSALASVVERCTQAKPPARATVMDVIAEVESQLVEY